MSDAGNTRFDVAVACPACGAEFRVPRIRRGATEACPVCAFKVRVPGEGAYEESGGAAPTREVPPVADEWAAPAAPSRREPPAPLSGTCIVCAREDERYNPLAVAPHVARATGENPAQVKMNLARGRGVLAEGLPAEAAAALAEAITNARVPAVAIPADAVPEVEKELPLICVHAAGEDGLRAQVDVQGTVKTLPWDMVIAAFCCRDHVVHSTGPNVEVETDFFPAAGGVGMPPVRRTRYTASRRAPDPDATCTFLLCGRSGSVYSMRCTERKVRYRYLGARRGGGTAQNFGLFITDVMRHCRNAFFPATTRAVAAGRRMKMARVKNDADYDRYLHWVLCCIAAGR